MPTSPHPQHRPWLGSPISRLLLGTALVAGLTFAASCTGAATTAGGTGGGATGGTSDGSGGSTSSSGGATGSGGDSGSGSGGQLGTGSGGDGTGGATTGTGGMGDGGTGGSAATGGNGGAGGDIGGGGGAGAGTGGRATGSGGRVGQGGTSGGSGGAASGGAGGTSGGATGGAAGASACVGATYAASSPPKIVTLSGSLNTHDPVIGYYGGKYYEFNTGLGAKTSTNMTSWSNAASPLALPSWARTATGASDLWAPDISFFGGMYHLYYAASTFGSNKSCIGQATRASMDSGSWADQGMVICSNMGSSDNWNAIDPNVVIDDDGTPWLALGSFWGGLKMVKLDMTGMRADTMVYSIAARPSAGGALEAPFVFKNCGYYYLFMSWDKCCQGVNSTYNIRVGRSTTITGPYVDKAGTQLMQGGGTLLVQGDSRWKGPGHSAVLVSGNATYNVYHSYDANNNGTSYLRISEMAWDTDGWPVSAGP